ncbi:MAG: iron ABC transporter permease [Deltaproteobacteria bacterium]|nr:iron ABC transporter permease [Deltaproteobacteria bacterium]
MLLIIQQNKRQILFGLFALLLFTSFSLNLVTGSVDINFSDIFRIVSQHITDSTNGFIVWKIRIPRSIAAVLGGAYLATSGLLLQVFFRNPIVGPYILGISSGATLMVSVVMLSTLSFGLAGISPYITVIAAFGGAYFVMMIILVVAGRVKNNITLLIIGLMMGYTCHAITSILIAFAESEKIKGFTLWQLGSFSGFSWNEVYLLIFLGGLLFAGVYLLSKPLNALLLGEDYASSMGVNIKLFRLLILLVSCALAGMVTAFAGPVAFVGLAVPHMARLVFGTSDNKLLIPGVALLGGIVTSICDLIARQLFSPVEIPVSAITAFFGAPVVISLLLKKRTSL